MRDNSVYMHECSPFGVDIFIIIKKKSTILLSYVDMCILIDKALTFCLYVIGKPNIR